MELTMSSWSSRRASGPGRIGIRPGHRINSQVGGLHLRDVEFQPVRSRGVSCAKKCRDVGVLNGLNMWWFLKP